MTERPDRSLPKEFVQSFMLAISEEIGNFSLQLVLQQAGYDGFPSGWTEDEPVGMRASQFAAIQRCLREYYGRGSRGLLQRVGRETWALLVQNTSPGRRASIGLLKIAPRAFRTRQVLDLLAEKMSEPDGKVSVQSQNLDLVLVDQTSDSTFGQKSPGPICWMTLGLIQGALFWAIGNEMEVEETCCCAAGAEACKFVIKRSH